MQTVIDRPYSPHIKNFDRVFVELSPYMTEFEIEKTIDFMSSLKDTKYDINPTVNDAIGQLTIMFSKDRVDQLINTWKAKNQKLMTIFGTKKYKRKSDNTIWDGLDSTDDPNDYEDWYV